jgi:hypothetical protein
MKTRSQTKKERENIMIIIDFDEASEAWYANKKRMQNGMCKYICLGKYKNGTSCNKPPLQWQNYCDKHAT